MEEKLGAGKEDILVDARARAKYNVTIMRPNTCAVGSLVQEGRRSRERLITFLKQGRLVPRIMVTIDGRRALRGLQEQVAVESEVRFLPVMAGG